MTFCKFEEQPKGFNPPKEIWTDGEKLQAFFAQAEKDRDRSYGIDGDGAIEDPVQNDAAKDMIVGG